MQNPSTQQITAILDNFQLEGLFHEINPISSGHIHSSFLVTFNSVIDPQKFILQRVNTHVFPESEPLINNIRLVTDHLRKQVASRGKNSATCVVEMIPTQEGDFLLKQPNGDLWRMFTNIDHADTFELVENEKQVYQAGLAIGDFIFSLADFPVEQLIDTIPMFHHTPSRFKDFLAVMKADRIGRAQEVREEIGFVLERQEITAALVNMLDSGELPLRVIHNDTKISNVLFDRQSGDSICMIDLDTVMPGTSLYDFGDAARTMTATAAEDERDLSLVDFNQAYFEKLTAGFIHGMQDSLTPGELKMIPESAILMTLECGIRFLGDFLDGDRYFHTEYDDHNLVRARVQFKLVERMEANLDFMHNAVKLLVP
ncbi:MAG: aminoglycoside phosphotransferase family protein [Chloroflexota bacterium]